MKSSTINKQEIEKFSKIAAEWWDPMVNTSHCTNLIQLELDTLEMK